MKFVITQAHDDLKARKELEDRIDRLSQPIIQMTPFERSVHFLRGVNARATFASAAFHSFVAAGSADGGTPIVPGHPGVVFRHYLKHTAFASLTLDCRKVFDEKKSGLSGAFFASVSDQVLLEHADFWADQSKESRGDALAALTFLRHLFRRLSRPRADLIKKSSLLEKRIGFIKFHADRSAAHLSLDDYAVHILDLSHMVAALVFIGEIISPFDSPWESPGRFNPLDASAVAAARTLFPDGYVLAMFAHMDVAHHARKCWQEPAWGLEYLLNGLPAATGWA
ncbi:MULTISPECIES: hypothetical protein [Luteibacter]|uniref:hypothetical protein n=1 Tax=Luteibacter TaxID=242605 RepID=UPI00068C4585|nr:MULTISPECIES: hypothetical protein [unclassified Luteibacter]